MTDSSISMHEGTTALAEAFAEPAWLAEHLSDPQLRVVEVDVSRTAYQQGHIPGAILWNIYADLRHADYSLLDRSELEEVLGRSGLTPRDTIVFYGYGAYLGFWLMKAYGHERVLMLQGTRQDWRDRGRPWTMEVPEPVASSTYTLSTAEPALLISQGELVRTALGTGDPLILDARSDAEFTGERFWPSGATEGAGRPGHIPGAVHLHVDLFHRPDGSFKTPAELQAALPGPWSSSRARCGDLLHHRQSGERGGVCPDVPAGVSRCSGVLRLLGAVGYPGGDPDRGLRIVLAPAESCTRSAGAVHARWTSAGIGISGARPRSPGDQRLQPLPIL